jgi:hypothetical protein
MRSKTIKVQYKNDTQTALLGLRVSWYSLQKYKNKGTPEIKFQVRASYSKTSVQKFNIQYHSLFT